MCENFIIIYFEMFGPKEILLLCLSYPLLFGDLSSEKYAKRKINKNNGDKINNNITAKNLDEKSITFYI